MPYIHRKVATYDNLSEEGLCLIEQNADAILRDTGMEFRDDSEILDYFRKAGADVQGKRVRFEPDVCRKLSRRRLRANIPSTRVILRITFKWVEITLF